ncbi:hypothetical protein G5714_004400 [Onychostoma macrolepis]|uniref:Uncharacterized protein n=1 Tax=Onychostoma macrolepis TaxID=369639 RepID=A0A7J6D4M5_9TELE|nr:hypothetical protein G5714_004400 [Onychostoma macrolepis]
MSSDEEEPRDLPEKTTPADIHQPSFCQLQCPPKEQGRLHPSIWTLNTLGSMEDTTYHPSPVSSEASSMSSEASCPLEENDWEDNLEEVMDLGENKDDTSDQEDSKSSSSWASQFQVKSNAVDHLLKTLQRHGHTHLPSSARTLLKTPRQVTTMQKCGKEYLHYPLRQQLLDNLENVAMCFLVSPTLIEKHSAYARSLLSDFVSRGQELYGNEFIVYNIHSMLHITDDAVQFNGLDNCSAFKFETYLHSIKKMTILRRPSSGAKQQKSEADINVKRSTKTPVRYDDSSDDETPMRAPPIKRKHQDSPSQPYWWDLCQESDADSGENIVWSHFSLKGKREKLPLTDTSVCKVIKYAVKSELGEKDVECYIAETLKHVPAQLKKHVQDRLPVGLPVEME